MLICATVQKLQQWALPPPLPSIPPLDSTLVADALVSQLK